MALTNCYFCGGDVATVRESAEITIGNRAALVDVDRSRCANCGEVVYTPEQMDAAQTAAVAKLREQDHLLGPKEIKALRARYGLTQAQLERLLGVGPKTVVRWERGTVCQSRTADELLRLIDSMPAVFDYLSQRNGIETTHVLAERGFVQMANFVLAADTLVADVAAAKRRRRARASDPQIVDIAEFTSKKTQQKTVTVESEASIPFIPMEALR